jgi:hypothetical protein
MVFLFLHSRYFWMFLIGPALLYIIEKIYGSQFFRLVKDGRTYITDAKLLSSQVWLFAKLSVEE